MPDPSIKEPASKRLLQKPLISLTRNLQTVHRIDSPLKKPTKTGTILKNELQHPSRTQTILINIPLRNMPSI